MSGQYSNALKAVRLISDGFVRRKRQSVAANKLPQRAPQRAGFIPTSFSVCHTTADVES